MDDFPAELPQDPWTLQVLVECATIRALGAFSELRPKGDVYTRSCHVYGSLNPESMSAARAWLDRHSDVIGDIALRAALMNVLPVVGRIAEAQLESDKLRDKLSRDNPGHEHPGSYWRRPGNDPYDPEVRFEYQEIPGGVIVRGELRGVVLGQKAGPGSLDHAQWSIFRAFKAQAPA